MRFIDKNINTTSLVLEAQALLDNSNTYNQSDRVREIIRLLYSNCCAFCECSPEDSSFFHIEHYYPKNIKRFSAYTKRIENLHYSCQRCNTLKGGSYYPNILSPNYYLEGTSWKLSNQYKIESELFYVGHLLFSKDLKESATNRGQSTINLFDLNNQNNSNRSSRQFLVERRLRVFSKVVNVLNALFELLSNYVPVLNNTIEILFSMLIKYTNQTEHFSTMVVHNFGKEIYKLLLVYIEIRNQSSTCIS